MVVSDEEQDVWQRHCSCCSFYRRCTSILGLLAIGLVTFLMLRAWSLFTWDDNENSAEYIKTDDLFRDVPIKQEIVNVDDAFVDSDPMDGRNWNTSSDGTTSWDSIYPSTVFIAVDSSEHPIDTKNTLKSTAADPSIWTDRDQAFGVAALHQLHCVGSLKHSFTEFEKTGSITASANHISHCIETLRQAVMCAADLTLERLDLEDSSSPLKPQRGNSGWGNAHNCRDWTRLIELFWQRGIVKSKNGWTKVTNFNKFSGRV